MFVCDTYTMVSLSREALVWHRRVEIPGPQIFEQGDHDVHILMSFTGLSGEPGCEHIYFKVNYTIVYR